ncbi:MAG TPA: hypothetical protein VEK37_07600, partial [Gemmatimonadaceae bacterium]|nr:hypothetical protein [Gemmatimonadaceae bacterium]
VVLKFRPQAKVDPVRLVALVRQRPDLTLVPPAALRLTLDTSGGSELMGKAGQKPSTVSHQPSAISPSRGRKSPAPPPSWWVARAKDAEVKPGFNKAAMTRTAKEDPRAPGGVFEQVGGLLSDLLDQR